MSLKRKLSFIMSLLSMMNIMSVNSTKASYDVYYNDSDDDFEGDFYLDTNDSSCAQSDDNYDFRELFPQSKWEKGAIYISILAGLLKKIHENSITVPKHSGPANPVLGDVTIDDILWTRTKETEEDWPEKITMGELKKRAEKLWKEKGFTLKVNDGNSVSVKAEIWTKEEKDKNGQITKESKLLDDKTLLYYAPDGLFGPFYVVKSSEDKNMLDTVAQGKLPTNETILEDISEKRNSILVDLLKQLKSGLQKELTLTDKENKELDLSLGDVLYIMKKVVAHRRDDRKKYPEMDVLLYLFGIRPKNGDLNTPQGTTLFEKKNDGSNLAKMLKTVGKGEGLGILGGFLTGFGNLLEGADEKKQPDTPPGLTNALCLLLYLPTIMPMLTVGSIPDGMINVLSAFKALLWSPSIPVYTATPDGKSETFYFRKNFLTKSGGIQHNDQSLDGEAKDSINAIVDWKFDSVVLNLLWNLLKNEISKTLKPKNFRQFFEYLVSSLTGLQKTVESVVRFVDEEKVLDKLGNGDDARILNQVHDLKEKGNKVVDKLLKILEKNYKDNEEKNKDENDKNIKEQVEKLKEFGETLDKMNLKSKKTTRALALIKDLIPLLKRNQDDTTLDVALAGAEHFDKKIVAFHE